MESTNELQVKPKMYRFDIFRGVEDASGKIHKLRSVGNAQVVEGSKTYTVNIKTFLEDTFYLMPERKFAEHYDYVILTRSLSTIPGKKYFWNTVGEGKLLSGANAGLLKLDWDVLGIGLYMNLYPTAVYGGENSDKHEAEAA